MTEGYRALRERAAWLDLSARGKIVVTGEDSARLLHALSTHHIEEIRPGEGRYVFFLNAQGRIQADANLLRFDDNFLLDTEPEIRQRLFEHIDKYIIADDVTLEDATGRLSTIALEGPGAAAALSALSAPVPEDRYSHQAWSGMTVQKASATGGPGFRLFVAADCAHDLIARLESIGATRASAEDARMVRLEHGIPRYGEDILDTTLPQESRQMQAIHFNKGCYLGQEIVERIRSRGHVNRLLIGFESDATEPPQADTAIEAQGAGTGNVTSALFSPALAKTVGLGYVRAQHAQPGTELRIAGQAARVRSEAA
jgi:tRNA-modifying protein YgfZ